MSKTKKINNRRRKNKTRKTRMMKGGTITHDKEANIFVRKNNSPSNREQERFFNVVLPQYLGIQINDANALIQYLQEKELNNLNLIGNTFTSNGHRVANISSPKNLKALIGVIREKNVELLASGDLDSAKKLQSVIHSLEIQNMNRSGSSEEGHIGYHDSIIQLETSVRALRGMEEGAGQSSKSIDSMVSEQLSAAFAIPNVSSGSSGFGGSSGSSSSKGCSNIVVRLPESVVGKVIGQKGENIRKIQGVTQTIITSVKSGDFVNFTVKCKNNAANSDVEGAAEILRNYSSVTFNVPYTSGRAINKLKKGLDKDTGTRINVSKPIDSDGSSDLEVSVTIKGHPDNIKIASDRIRKISKQAQASQGRKPESSSVGLDALMKRQNASKKKNNVDSHDVDHTLHDALVARIGNVRNLGAILTVGETGGSNKITITIQGGPKARKRALTYLKNEFGKKWKGGRKTRKKRKNKSRKKKRRNKKRRTRRRR